jgi:hypothetical protein
MRRSPYTNSDNPTLALRLPVMTALEKADIRLVWVWMPANKSLAASA